MKVSQIFFTITLAAAAIALPTEVKSSVHTVSTLSHITPTPSGSHLILSAATLPAATPNHVPRTLIKRCNDADKKAIAALDAAAAKLAADEKKAKDSAELAKKAGEAAQAKRKEAADKRKQSGC